MTFTLAEWNKINRVKQKYIGMTWEDFMKELIEVWWEGRVEPVRKEKKIWKN